jgi:hypothetical protein
VGLRIKNVRITGGEDCGISVWYSADALIEGCRIFNSTSPFAAIAKNTGYGISMYAGTRDSVIRDCYFYNCRHSVSGGSTPQPMYILVEGTKSVDCGIGTLALDCHEPCFWWTFQNNFVEGGFGGGVFRGQYTKIIGNHFSGGQSDGIRIRSYYDNSEGINGVVIQGNSINGGTSGYGVFFDNTQANINGAVVQGNSFHNTRFASIGGCGVNGLIVDGNSFDSVQLDTGTEGNLIHLFGKSVTIGTSDARGDNKNVVITNNVFTNALAHGARITYCDGLQFQNNTLYGFVNNTTAVNGVYLFECNNATLSDNTIDMPNGFFAIRGENSDNVTVRGGFLKGGSGLANQDGVYFTHLSGPGSTIKNITVSDVSLSDFERYGVLTRYADNVVIRGLTSLNCGTCSILDSSRTELIGNKLTTSDGQIYTVILNTVDTAVLTDNSFMPGAGGQAGVYETNSSATNKSCTMTSNEFGAFSNFAAILENVDHFVATNNMVFKVSGTAKWAITGNLSNLITNNIPGNTGLFPVIVTGTSANATLGSNYILTNASKTAITLPASPLAGMEVQFTVANGRTDNEVARNGNNIQGLAENLILDNANLSITLQYVSASLGWRIV